jgi:hypothetical protein
MRLQQGAASNLPFVGEDAVAETDRTAVHGGRGPLP